MTALKIGIFTGAPSFRARLLQSWVSCFLSIPSLPLTRGEHHKPRLKAPTHYPLLTTHFPFKLFRTFPQSHQAVSIAHNSFNPLDFRQRHSNPRFNLFPQTHPVGFPKLAAQRANLSRKPFLFIAKPPLPSSPPFNPSNLPFNPQFLPFPVSYFTPSLIHAILVHVPLDNLPSPRFRFSQRPQLLCVQPIPAPLSSRAQRRFCFSPPAPHLPLITRHSSPMSFPWHSFVPRCGLGYEPGDQPAFLF